MAGQLISNDLAAYLASFVPSRPAEMEAMEAYAEETNFPIVGPTAGYLCYQIARMTGARSVFELGSGYGYSTAWFARAVQENGGGVVHHTEREEKLSQKARRHLSALGLDDLVAYHLGDAVEALRDTPGPFDIIFTDLDKKEYPDTLPPTKEKLRAGGVLLADNALWGGRIVDESDRAARTEALRAFNQRVLGDPVWIAMPVPVGDGLLIAVKRE